MSSSHLGNSTSPYLLGLSNKVQLSIHCNISTNNSIELLVLTLRVSIKVEIFCLAHELNGIIVITAVCGLIKNRYSSEATKTSLRSQRCPALRQQEHTAYRRVVIPAHFSCGRIFFSLSPHLLACTKAKLKGDLEHVISKGWSTSKIDRDEGSPASMGPAEICNKTRSGGCIGLAENWSFRGNVFKQELETAGSKRHCADDCRGE